MKKHTILGIIIMAIIILSPVFVHAQFVSRSNTVGFGGKVLTPQLSFVTCPNGAGTGPVVLVSNLASLGSAVYSAAGTGQPTPSRIGKTALGIYGAIPFYAEMFSSVYPFVEPVPKFGDWILGQANIAPETSSCYIPLGSVQIPFPVRDTAGYSLSR